MKPRFEEHDGMLFEMLEEPVPLTPDAEMPCLVRYIQDSSPMGRYMKRKYPLVINTVAIVSRIGTDWRAYSQDKIFAEEVEVLEIIGYHVAEGSKEWALHQMMQGEKVCRKISPAIVYCKHTNGIGREVRDTYYVESISAWLNGADKDGWQLYKEPEPQYKVGDWVEHEKSKEQGRITYISSDNYDAIEVKLYDQDELETYTKSDFNADFRKLSHSEVVVDFGFAKGRILSRMSGYVKVLNNKSVVIATIIVSEITNPTTRELVESLLKAQEEE